MPTMNNPASTAETVQSSSEVGIPFPSEHPGQSAHGVASENDSQAPDPALEADAAATDGEPEGEAGGDPDGGDGTPNAENEADPEQSRNKVPAKQRIKQLSTKAREADNRAAAAERRAQSAEAQLRTLNARERPREAADYETDAAYTAALIKDSVAEARAEALKSVHQEALADREQASRDAWLEKSETMRQRAPDFDAVVTSPNVSITGFMKDAITGDDNGPEVVYWLGKNPAEAARISALPPIRQVAEIGRLSARFSSAPEPKKVTAAPAPRKTLQGHGTTPTKDPSKMDHAEYRAWRAGVNEQRRAGSPQR